MPGDIWGWIIVAGIPSAVAGILIGRLQRQIAKRDRAKDDLDADRVKNEMMMIRLSMASLTLGEATAQAVQRIPDAHCNGDMTAALERAQNAKQDYHEFEREQTAKRLK